MIHLVLIVINNKHISPNSFYSVNQICFTYKLIVCALEYVTQAQTGIF